MGKFRILVYLVLIFSLIALLPVITASPSVQRYTVVGNIDMLWDTQDTFPFEIIEPVCWNEEYGWGCDERIRPLEYAGLAAPNGSPMYTHYPERDPHEIGYFIDWLMQVRGTIYENSYGCWYWLWPDDIGTDGNPHPMAGDWIVCPDLPPYAGNQE